MTFSKSFSSGEGCLDKHSVVELSAPQFFAHLALLSLGTIFAHTFHMPKVSTKTVLTVYLSIPTSLAVTKIVKRWSLPNLFNVGISCGSAMPPWFQIILHILSAFHKSLVPFKISCSGHERISINITQHLQSLSRCFSKFHTKFNVNSLLNRHSAIELSIAKKLNQILNSNFLQQVINHIYLWLWKSKNNCDIVSKQLLNKEHM